MAKKYNIAVIPGDGIGPEITASAIKVLDAVCSKYEIEIFTKELKAGGAAVDQFGIPLPQETIYAAKDSDADYIQGLDLGSDDYFTKPFSPVKLVSKVKSVLKRQEDLTGKTSAKETDDGLISFADIVINRKTKEATLAGEQFPLTPNEYALLTYLISNRDRAISRTELLDKIWGYETQVETRVADDTVKRLRKKISHSGARISTIWGYGFRLVMRTDEDGAEGDDSDD
jgi:isocitrate/isopropylmalate dehydrogenase